MIKHKLYKRSLGVMFEAYKQVNIGTMTDPIITALLAGTNTTPETSCQKGTDDCETDDGNKPPPVDTTKGPAV